MLVDGDLLFTPVNGIGRFPHLPIPTSILVAIVFGANQLGTVFILTGASSLAKLDPALLGEIFFLNGLLELVADERYTKDGLVAASGVHFWADVIFHVFWKLF